MVTISEKQTHSTPSVHFLEIRWSVPCKILSPTSQELEAQYLPSRFSIRRNPEDACVKINNLILNILAYLCHWTVAWNFMILKKLRTNLLIRAQGTRIVKGAGAKLLLPAWNFYPSKSHFLLCYNFGLKIQLWIISISQKS